MVPAQVEQQLHDLLQSGDGETKLQMPVTFNASEPKIPVPARMASGDVGLHQDCLNPFDDGDPGFIAGYIAIIYLDGSGSFIMKSGSHEERVDIVPRRLVMWRNCQCFHGVEAAPGCGRAMLGPMTLDGDGWIQRAHDIHSVHAMDHFRNRAEAAEAAGNDAGVREALANASTYNCAYGHDFSGQLLQEYEKRQAGKPQMVITLSKEETGDGKAAVLVGTGISGERLYELELTEPNDLTIGKVRQEFTKQLSTVIQAHSGGTYLKFVLPDGTLIEEDDLKVSELFKEGTAAGVSEKTPNGCRCNVT